MGPEKMTVRELREALEECSESDVVKFTRSENSQGSLRDVCIDVFIFTGAHVKEVMRQDVKEIEDFI